MKAWWEVNKAGREATDACLGKVKTETDAYRKGMKTCQEETKAYPEKREANPGEMKSLAEQGPCCKRKL
jgi:hypothetical protein